MFADDVMVFFGSSNSQHGISECLDDFDSWSELHMNHRYLYLWFHLWSFPYYVPWAPAHEP